MKSNWLRGGTAPKIAKSGVTHGALTSAQRVRNILNAKIRRERKGVEAEILGETRREIEQAKERRQRIQLERRAIDQAVNESILEFPAASMKIKRDKSGAPFIQRRYKGKFLPSVKVAAGFTLTEVAAVLVMLFSALLVGGLFYVAFHFISKYW